MNGIKALTFDTGGTVLDWHTGITRALAQAGQRHGLELDWPAIANEYRRRSLRRMVGSVSPGFNIDDVHRDILDELVNEHSLTALSRQDQVEILRAWHTLRTWSDFGPALNRLRTAYPVVSFTILSTALVIDVSRLNGITWDCLICCEMLDVYKTRPASLIEQPSGLLAQLNLQCLDEVPLGGGEKAGRPKLFCGAGAERLIRRMPDVTVVLCLA